MKKWKTSHPTHFCLRNRDETFFQLEATKRSALGAVQTLFQLEAMKCNALGAVHKDNTLFQLGGAHAVQTDKTVYKIEFFFHKRITVYTNMPRKTEFSKRKGKDKAKEHRQKCGKYDGKATRRALEYLAKTTKPVLTM